MDDKKLQQNAFMWFKEQYGSTPEELGYKVIATRDRHVCFIRNKQVIFAKNQSDSDTFIKEQTIIEKAITYSMLVLLIMAGLLLLMLFSFATNNTKPALQAMYIGMSISFLAIVSLIICYKKLKPLEKQCKDVIIYAA